LSQDLPILKKGSFYFIKDGQTDLIMEDKTKRGLTVKERWFFPKQEFTLEKVLVHAEAMEKKYKELRELTCPEDDD